MKLLSLALSLPLIASPGDETVVQGELGRRIDRYVSRLEGLGFSGSLLVARKGEILLAKGYGLADRAGGVANDIGTVYPLGSISKHFTAAGILRLEMDEVVSVDDPLSYFFEELPPDKQDITLHQLLTHSSGFAAASSTVLGATSREDFIARVMDTRLLFSPGRDVSYSNLGYGVLAAVIETVTGEEYEAWLREAIFLPAGMKRTGAMLADWRPGSQAHGYIDGQDTGALLGGGGMGWGLIGAGGLSATLHDMLRWNQALDAGSVLDLATVQRMTSARVQLGPDVGMGYGTGVDLTDHGTPRVGHDGSNDVFSADFRRYPEDELFIFGAGNDADMYVFDFLPVVEQISFGAEIEDPPLVTPMGRASLEAYAGNWQLAGGGVVEVGASERGLSLTSADSEAALLLHPVRATQVVRRRSLLEDVGEAFEAAFEGDLEPLHRLLDPFVPLEEFMENQAARLDHMADQLGGFLSVATVPGRNRFGEIAIVVVLGFEDGEQMIEYSFGDREVGSIRLLDEFPSRFAHPESRESFVAYDAESGESWRVGFRIGESGPEALLLEEADRKPVEARRIR